MVERMVIKSERSDNSDSKSCTCISAKKLNAAQFQLLQALCMLKSFGKYQVESAKLLRGNGVDRVCYRSGKLVI
jgi:hypothetical protein